MDDQIPRGWSWLWAHHHMLGFSRENEQPYQRNKMEESPKCHACNKPVDEPNDLCVNSEHPKAEESIDMLYKYTWDDGWDDGEEFPSHDGLDATTALEVLALENKDIEEGCLIALKQVRELTAEQIVLDCEYETCKIRYKMVIVLSVNELSKEELDELKPSHRDGVPTGPIEF